MIYKIQFEEWYLWVLEFTIALKFYIVEGNKPNEKVFLIMAIC